MLQRRSDQRREIGVRVALGASRRRLVAAIFWRPLTHVGFGVLAGGLLIAVAAFALSGGDGGLTRVEGGFSLSNVALLLAYIALRRVAATGLAFENRPRLDAGDTKLYGRPLLPSWSIMLPLTAK